ncbi:alkaline phosphatase D family protein [Sphingomonas sp. BN140010]|uniref:Alkaline phosphatase D family protein n=1 Tax=Sphingomonas arvum TaxID=2992113 RepID=A0ABT3JGC6_9SPHN|nr:alkaline phosphatase D family protein [Sphingomonas sp. BN140010]MCW3798059.1 alkaline phosphatase D family protein [Sphingomonas sp. BN140010]
MSKPHALAGLSDFLDRTVNGLHQAIHALSDIWRHEQNASDLAPNGVASGDVTDDSAVLWARSLTPGTLRFEVSLDPDFHAVIRRAVVAVDAGEPAHALIGHLRDGVRYYYRAVDGDGDTLTGTFTTAYSDGYHGLTFGVSGDWRGANTPYAAISNADDANLAFFVQLGDTIYADRSSRALPFDEARTLEQFHVRYIETLTERGGENFLADLRASTSSFAMIDDHEVIDDFAGGAPASSDPRFVAGTANFINETEFYRNGTQAFQNYQPIAQRTWSGTGEDRVDGAPDFYRTQNYGDDAAIFMVDARTFRDEELVNPDITNPADVGRFLTQSFDPSRTMLGEPQLERLEADLLKAEAHGVLWKFVMLPEPIQNLGPAEASDRYEGYAAERTALLKFIDDHDLHNVVFVTADIHGTVVNNLTYQLAPGAPQVALDSWEIATGSVAFGTPFGRSVVDLARAAGLVSNGQFAFYNSLPVAPDPTDSAIPNDKDDYLENLINTVIRPFGYDPLGLDYNLAGTDGLVDATLLQGDYVAAHTYGWTQFAIDPVTHELTVTTYGVPSYRESDPGFDPNVVADLQPVIVSQFRVSPDQVITGRSAPDQLTGGNGDDLIDGGKGNDVLTGAAGSERFVFTPDGGRDLVTDFHASEGDRLLLSGFGPAVDTADEAMAYARQVGADVLFEFASHAEIRLAGASLADVRDALLFA